MACEDTGNDALGTPGGSRTCVAEVLNRKRNLSIAMIRRLNAELGIPAEILVQPSRRDNTRSGRGSRKPARAA